MSFRRVRRVLLSAVFLIGALAIVNPLEAQQSRLSPKEIGQIVDAVLNTLVPPTERLSWVPVAKRGIFLDVAQTLKTFGYSDSATMPTLSDLHLHSVVKPGSHRLLDDCSQIIPKSCSHLGWSTYVVIERLSGTRSPLRVRADIVWPDRGNAVFEEGVAPLGQTNLVGFSQGGSVTKRWFGSGWKYARDSVTAVM